MYVRITKRVRLLSVGYKPSVLSPRFAEISKSARRRVVASRSPSRVQIVDSPALVETIPKSRAARPDVIGPRDTSRVTRTRRDEKDLPRGRISFQIMISYLRASARHWRDATVGFRIRNKGCNVSARPEYTEGARIDADLAR